MRMAKLEMLQLLVLLALLNAASSQTLQSFPKLCNVRNFDDFLEQTGKVYTDEREREFRESIFAAKKSLVDLSNSRVGSYRLSINILADLTRKEVATLLGSKISTQGEEYTASHINFVPATPPLSDKLPESFDWREKGGVTPAGFQGINCGSCWSFSTIGALEGHLFRRTGVLVPLSQQNLMDCADDYGNMGCDGGFQEYGFEYIRDHGVTLANKYPYVQSEMECRQNETAGRYPRESIVKIRDYARIDPGDEQKMKQVIATLGPLACSMNAGAVSFEQYEGGIYEDDECNKDEVNHSVVVVGYGNENGRDYWIIKNSYSQNWGEQGFMRLPRNAGSFCGIASECSYPIL
ncbi:procathepsin L [Drosophila grimshawi]|uniref:GH21038 n=1 Tax=Drosophila grimshawi TaxID=7222 RepID=B4J588_DROGR|nr:procathepsin L [Drosophila grimshawi]EDW00714.1 GH21038 [Drosophila grimshawi]